MKFLNKLRLDKNIFAEKNFNLICTVVLVVLLSYFLFYNKEFFMADETSTDVCNDPKDPITKIDCMTQRIENIIKGLGFKEQQQQTTSENVNSGYKFFKSCKTN